MIFTIFLAIIFAVKKTQYKPEEFQDVEEKGTEKLHDRQDLEKQLTDYGENQCKTSLDTVLMEEDVPQYSAEQTELMTNTKIIKHEFTER